MALTFRNPLITGTPARAKKEILDYLNVRSFINDHTPVKIGITGQHPNNRLWQHRRDDWENMEVIYKTSSEADANLLEKELIRTIDYWDVELANAKAGGGSRLSDEAGEYYLYVLYNN